MRNVLLLATTAFIIGCAMRERQAPTLVDPPINSDSQLIQARIDNEHFSHLSISDPRLEPNQGGITYYDRNGDGVIDFELHRYGCCDRDWALVDRRFSGRYDLKIRWGYGLEKSNIDLAVPKNVHISSGDPPVSVAW